MTEPNQEASTRWDVGPGSETLKEVLPEPARKDSIDLPPLFGPEAQDDKENKLGPGGVPTQCQALDAEAALGGAPDGLPLEPPPNESLLSGFTILRLAQLLNIDVYYVGDSSTDEPKRPHNTPDVREDLWAQQQRQLQGRFPAEDELAQVNPFRGLVPSHRFLRAAFSWARICLSLVAIMISVDKTISTVVLCLVSRRDVKGRLGNTGLTYEASDVTMSWLVLILINLSSMYILFSTVFNGHLLWRLLSQRLFLVNRRFQYKTMLSLLVFIYLEYIVNISFINNLFGWSFEVNEANAGIRLRALGAQRDDERRSPRHGGQLAPDRGHGRPSFSHNIHSSYSVLAMMQTFVTEKDETNALLDLLLTCFQFARGIIRVSPYITINYVTICLIEHIKTIRNQSLLTDSLKKKQKLRMVVKNRRANQMAGGGGGGDASLQANNAGGSAASAALRARDTNARASSSNSAAAAARKKRVIFVTEASAGNGTSGGANSCAASQSDGAGSQARPLVNLEVTSALGRHTPSPIGSLADSSRAASSLSDWADTSSQSLGFGASSPVCATLESQNLSARNSQKRLYSLEGDRDPLACAVTRTRGPERARYLERIRDFGELEAYITNLYIFTGRLNKVMSRQGLAIFFIVHNLVISSTLIVPEAISGGPPMATAIRLLVILIGIVPFVAGQALNGQLGQLSKQIDRIIIQQQFIGRKRDNLVRIRELLDEIRVNCGGMLNFNVESGIKYLVVVLATAFFIEQEYYKLTRRH